MDSTIDEQWWNDRMKGTRLGVLYGPGSVTPGMLRRSLGPDVHIDWLLLKRPSGPELSVLAATGHVQEIDPSNPNLGCHLDGITTFCDENLEALGRLAAALGLTGYPIAAMGNLSSKSRQRSALSHAGLQETRFVVDKAASLVGRDVEVPFPCVLKPDRGTGSRHAYVCESLEQLWNYAAVLAMDHDEADYIVEEFFGGTGDSEWSDIVSVETLSFRGSAKCVAVLGKTKSKDLRPTGQFFPASLDAAAVLEVASFTTRAVEALGVVTGSCHVEVKFSPQGLRVIEVNGRLGAFVPQIMECQGLNLIRMSVGASCGIEPQPDTPFPKSSTVTFCVYPMAPPLAGHLSALTPIANLRRVHGVTRVRQNLKIGDLVDPSKGLASRVYEIHGSVRSHAELAQTLRTIERAVWVEMT